MYAAQVEQLHEPAFTAAVHPTLVLTTQLNTMLTIPISLQQSTDSSEL